MSRWLVGLGRETTYELGLWVSPVRRGSSVGLPAAQTRVIIFTYYLFLDVSWWIPGGACPPARRMRLTTGDGCGGGDQT